MLSEPTIQAVSPARRRRRTETPIPQPDANVCAGQSRAAPGPERQPRGLPPSIRGSGVHRPLNPGIGGAQTPQSGVCGGRTRAGREAGGWRARPEPGPGEQGRQAAPQSGDRGCTDPSIRGLRGLAREPGRAGGWRASRGGPGLAAGGRGRGPGAGAGGRGPDRSLRSRLGSGVRGRDGECGFGRGCSGGRVCRRGRRHGRLEGGATGGLRVSREVGRIEERRIL